MQTKTINNNISQKINLWLASIADTELANDLKNKILVSGGSITSMFLNEAVNDYDIYLMDRDVLIRLVQYYIKPFDNLSLFDGTKKDVLIDNYREGFTVEEFMKHPGKKASALRTLKDDQVKIFINSSNGGFKVDKESIKEGLPFQPVFFSPNAISLSDDLQIVIRFWGSPETIHKTFDFIHATNYWTYDKGVVLNLAAVESLLTKQLKYQGSFYPVTSIIRTRKFLKRGFNIGAGELLKIMFQISMLDLTDMDTLEEQLIGVDVAYFEILIDALRDHLNRNPEFKITPEYFNKIIDNIFQGSTMED